MVKKLVRSQLVSAITPTVMDRMLWISAIKWTVVRGDERHLIIRIPSTNSRPSSTSTNNCTVCLGEKEVSESRP